MATITAQEFATKIKTKYPQYADIDDMELAKRTIDVHPVYADRVSFEGGAPSVPTEEPEKKEGFLASLAKPFTKTAATGIGVVSSIGKLLGGDVAGAQEAITKERQFGILGGAKPLGAEIEPTDKPLEQIKKGVGEFVGTGLELGSFLVPGGVAGKAGQIGLKAALKGGAKVGALAGGLGAGGAAVAEGKPAGQVLGEAALGTAAGGAFGAAIPAVGKGAVALAKGAGRVGGELVGKITGLGFSTVKELFENPNAVKYARQAGKEGSLGLQRTVVDDIIKGVGGIAERRSVDYRRTLRELGLGAIDMTRQLDDVRGSARGLLDEFDVRIGEGKKLNNLNYDRSRINADKGGGLEVQKAYNTLMQWTDSSAEGLDTLKKKLWDFVEGTKRNNDGSNIVTKKLWASVDSTLKRDVNGYEQLTSKFQQARALEDEFNTAFGLGGKLNEERIIKKFLSAFRQDNEFRREMLEAIEEISTKGGTVARPDISGKAAGILAAPTVPRGLVGTIIAGSGITASIMNPANIPILLTYLAIASPRLVAEGLSILGKFKGKTLPAVAKQRFLNLLIQAERILITEGGESGVSAE